MNLSLTVFDHFGTKMACQMVVSNYDVEESLLNIKYEMHENDNAKLHGTYGHFFKL